MEVALSLPSAFCLWFWSRYSLQSSRAWLETTDFPSGSAMGKRACAVLYCTILWLTCVDDVLWSFKGAQSSARRKACRICVGSSLSTFVMHIHPCKRRRLCYGVVLWICLFAINQLDASCMWTPLISLGWAWCGWVCCRNGTLPGAPERVTQGMMC